MVQKLDTITETPSQTAGPYVHIGCIPSFTGIAGVYAQDLGKRAIEPGAKGAAITITGKVFDGTGWTLRDAMLESWQADAAGLYPGQKGADPKVTGFCRFAADGDSGAFTLKTVKPGPVPGPRRAGGRTHQGAVCRLCLRLPRPAHAPVRLAPRRCRTSLGPRRLRDRRRRT